MLLSFFHRFLYLFKRTLISCRFETWLEISFQRKNYTTLPFLRGTVQKWCRFMHVMMWTLCKDMSYSFETHIAAQGMYWRIFALKKNMLKICFADFYFSSLGCAVFSSHGFQVNFLGRCPKPWEKSAKQCAPGWLSHEVAAEQTWDNGSCPLVNISKKTSIKNQNKKLKPKNKNPMTPMSQNHSWTSIAFFLFLSFWTKFGAEVCKKAWRETKHTHTQRKNSRLKNTKKHSNGGSHKWLGNIVFFFWCVCFNIG